MTPTLGCENDEPNQPEAQAQNIYEKLKGTDSENLQIATTQDSRNAAQSNLNTISMGTLGASS